MKRTKIICTLGPSSSTIEKVVSLGNSGMNIARLNFSHGTYAEHQDRIRIVREASKIIGRPISILQDLQGPKIRIGELATSSVELKENQDFEICTQPKKGNEKSVSTTYKSIVNDAKIGTTILIDDGLIKVRVTKTNKDSIMTKVVVGGTLKPNKGLNLPDVNISMPSLTEKDLEDVAFGLENNVNLIALSFVRSAEDVQELRKIISSHGKDTWIIAKIEKPQAIEDIDRIIDQANGIMVARGDLGVEMKGSHVPILQKEIVQKCSLANKPVIIATQMLESMTQSPVPTRAESSDVANAVFDGTDAVMLSAETASGLYPVETVKVMSDIIKTVESSDSYHLFEKLSSKERDYSAKDISQAIATSAVKVAENVHAKVIVVLSNSGQTSVRVSKQRPKVPIVVVTDSIDVYHRMSLVWNACAILSRTFTRAASMFDFVEKKLKEMKLVTKGDVIVYTLGIPILRKGTTDTIKITVIG